MPVPLLDGIDCARAPGRAAGRAGADQSRARAATRRLPARELVDVDAGAARALFAHERHDRTSSFRCATTAAIDYTPITERCTGRWPNGRGLAVYVALNLEQYAFGEGLVEDLVPGIPAPDVLNNSWREYGNRVGAWRLLNCSQQLPLPRDAADQLRALRRLPRN